MIYIPLQPATPMASKPHIVIFPFMAQGHIIPFLALAKTLEQKTSYTITLVNTPLNIQSLQSSLPPISTIRLMALPFNGPDRSRPPTPYRKHRLLAPPSLPQLLQGLSSTPTLLRTTHLRHLPTRRWPTCLHHHRHVLRMDGRDCPKARHLPHCLHRQRRVRHGPLLLPLASSSSP